MSLQGPEKEACLAELTARIAGEGQRPSKKAHNSALSGLACFRLQFARRDAVLDITVKAIVACSAVEPLPLRVAAI